MLSASVFHRCSVGVGAGNCARNGWTVWQIRWADLCREPPQQLVDKILRRSHSTDAEARGIPRQQQWNRIFPDDCRVEDQGLVWADLCQQGSSSNCSSKSLRKGKKGTHFSLPPVIPTIYSYCSSHCKILYMHKERPDSCIKVFCSSNIWRNSYTCRVEGNANKDQMPYKLMGRGLETSFTSIFQTSLNRTKSFSVQTSKNDYFLHFKTSVT